MSSPCSYPLADCIVNTALKKGSVDSVAAVAVTLVSPGFAESLLKERSVEERPLKFVECSGEFLMLLNLLQYPNFMGEDLQSYLVRMQD